jgi:hypothetical protein
MGGPNEMEDEIDAKKGDISKPGDVQVDSEDAFEAVVMDEREALNSPIDYDNV